MGQQSYGVREISGTGWLSALGEQVPMRSRPCMDVTGHKTVLDEIYEPPLEYTDDKISFNGRNRCYQTDESAGTTAR